VPRRPQRRPVSRKGSPKAPREDTGALDAGARRLLAANGGDVRQLEALVRDLLQLRDEADRLAIAKPSPDALRRVSAGQPRVGQGAAGIVLVASN
jgi:hypothetical protein